ncbi:MAG: glycosyltransferase family A protein [Rectinemataceae bacterium]|nr:glycosyltransferase family A protein [Rectinemataceae bacterium]
MLVETKARPSFAFLVLTYNHQDYILEHLESVKYLVLLHGDDIDVDLIINDDCSRDETQTLVKQWLNINASLFRHIKTLFNPKNLGTCASINNMLSHMVADRCKLTAGDDVYSFENIFKLTQYSPDVAMVSGRVLYLFGDVLNDDRLFNNLTTATQIIYQNTTLLHRFKHFSYNNAPNLLYATECLLHPTVRAFLGQFQVTEDLPLQVAIARQFPERRFALISEVLVYYRRTTGSTYIIASQRFAKDKNLIYDDLIKQEARWIERIRLLIRKSCFNSESKWVNKLLNLDFYFFLFSYASRVWRIIMHDKKLEMKVDQHRQHYARIRAAAMAVRVHINLRDDYRSLSPLDNSSTTI